jgi:ATP-dependent 26S proteasome regulatory subunit
MELDTRVSTLCAIAQGDPGRRYPSFALAMRLFDGAAWSSLSPERPLRFWRLLEINQPGAEPLTTSALRADERIVSFIKGLNYLDDRLVPLLVPFDIPNENPADLPPSQTAVADRVLEYVQQAIEGRMSPVVQLVGADALSRQLIACNVALRAHFNIYRLPVELLPKDSIELATFSRLWQRESTLLPIALFLDADVAERTSGDGFERESRSAIRRFLDRTGGAFFIGTREVLPQLGATSIAVDVTKPLPIEQREAWEKCSAQIASDDAAVLSGQFDLNVATIRTVSRLVTNANSSCAEHRDQVWRACLNATRPRLDLLAQRIEPKAGWEDIVLPDEARHLLTEIAQQVRARSRVYDEWGFRRRMSRGLGISALFAGESGTGKTMAAEVLARELRLNLYRIDLSAVVSKYIGETEKNLRQLFDAAEDGGAILFFDEADALFGKRSEVKDSHDRYANIEVNYLLQRMEAFEGLAILATNLRSALDRAFVRRLRFIVTFPFPSAEERAEIWKRMFPPETPVRDLDHAILGRLNLTGGSIHNVALNASFAAAREGGRVTMPLVLNAARAEFRKMEKPIKEADFRCEGPRELA